MKKSLFVSSLLFVVLLASNGFAQLYISPLPKGSIHGADVMYSDSDTITIRTGYGECCGEYWEITSEMDYDLTSLASAEDYHYIYINDNESSYPIPAITDSTTEPTWSDTYQGWYNGYDRCIGVVWSPSGSATITEFNTDGDGRYTYHVVINNLLLNGNPSSSFQTLEATTYTPVNTTAMYLWGFNTDAGSWLQVLVAAYENSYNRITMKGYHQVLVNGWIYLQRGWSRDLKWYGDNDDDNSFSIYLMGYKIER